MLLVLGVAVLAGCAEEPDELVFEAGFRPQASLPFVAVYVAQHNGYFADEGLAVRIEHSADGKHVERLERGEVDFTTATASGLIQLRGRREARGEPLPVMGVALFGQRGDRGYLVRRGVGIEAPEDFAGKVIGSNSAALSPELRALLASAKLETTDVRIERVGLQDLDRFLVGQIDVYPVFMNNEPDTARRLGHDVVVLDPHDFGVATLGLVLLTSEDALVSRPETVEAFLRATLRGALYASEHIDEAIEIALEYAPDADVDHQSYLLETDLRAAQRPDGIGRGDAAQWQEVIELLLTYDALEAPVEVADVFYGALVDQLYERGDLR